MTKAHAAIVLGGAENVMEEFAALRDLVREAGLTFENLCCNDMIAEFPEPIDHAITLHPEKFGLWCSERLRANRPGIGRVWSHRPFEGSTDHTQDWSGSVSLFATKVARTLGYTKVLLAGCPMTVEANHFRRHHRWNAAHGFRRGWVRHQHALMPYVRSPSGWTGDLFGHPSLEWLREGIVDAHVVPIEPVDLKA